MVHGVAEDFRDDPSKRLVLAHIGRKLNMQEMEIGSESFFGALDILIEGQQDYLRQRAYRFINRLFPQVKVDQIHMLLNSPTINYNAGTIIYRTGNGGKPEYVEMVLTGAVSYLDAELGVHSHMPFGSLMGAQELLSDAVPSKAIYRAVSHCAVIRFPAALFKAFLEHNGLLDHLNAVMDKVDFLRRTLLFGEQTTFRLVQLAQQLDWVQLQAGECLPEAEGEQLWLVVNGQVTLSVPGGAVIDTVKSTGFFGEESYLTPGRRNRWLATASCSSDLYRLNRPEIIQIPVVHWKMLEEHDNRCKKSM
jgi:hemerythrin